MHLIPRGGVKLGVMGLALALALVLAGAPDPRKGWEGYCPKGFTATAQGACLSTDRAHFKPGRLIVYFHGIAPNPRYLEPEVRTMAAAAAKRGFAVLALLGEPGLCPWAADVAKSYCWPTDITHPEQVERQEHRLSIALRGTARYLGQDPGQPFIAGFSNGGFFTSFLASASNVHPAAWIVLHAGGLTGQRFTAQRATPTLLVMATEDKVQFPSMVSLATELIADDWSPSVVTRGGYHQVRPEDARAVAEFCDEQVSQVGPLAAGGR